MIRYEVIRNFADLNDGYYNYRVGDEFPHAGVIVSKERYAELSGTKNKFGRPFIKAVEVEANDEAIVAEVETEKPKKKKGAKK